MEDGILVFSMQFIKLNGIRVQIVHSLSMWWEGGGEREGNVECTVYVIPFNYPVMVSFPPTHCKFAKFFTK